MVVMPTAKRSSKGSSQPGTACHTFERQQSSGQGRNLSLSLLCPSSAQKKNQTQSSRTTAAIPVRKAAVIPRILFHAYFQAKLLAELEKRNAKFQDLS